MRKFITDILAKTNLGVEQNAYVLGTVGIGTSTPIGNLDIYQAANPSLYIRDNSSIIRILPFGGITYFQTATSLSGGSTTDLYFSGMFGTPVNMVIKSDGNVLIGTTTNPGSKLYLVGSSARFENSSGSFEFDIYSSSNILRLTSSSNSAFIQNLQNNPLIFGTNATERMRITASGNVGIGTTSPTEKLHIVGDVLISDSSPSLIFTDTTNNTDAIIYTLDDGSLAFSADENNEVSGSKLLFYIDGGEKVRITDAGNVGIGTTNPLTKLWIEGNDITLNTEGSSQAKTLYFRYSNGAAINADSYLTFGTGGSPAERMRITDVGNVGIGTTSPSSTLDVSSSANATTMTITSDGANEQFRIRRYSDNNKQLIFGYHSSNFGTIQAVEQGVNYRNLILEPYGGNVGIGTTSPSKKLEVADSDIKVNGVTIGKGPGTISGNSNHNIAFGVNNFSSYSIADRAHIGIGYNAFQNITGGYYSIAIGGYAMDAVINPDESIAIGLDALGSATYPSRSVAIGNGALLSDTEGYGNVALGARAGNYLNSAFGGYGENTLIGNSAGNSLKNARETTVLGAGALWSTTSNTSLSRANTAIGASSAWAWLSGRDNVWLGYNTNGFINGSYNVIIGANVSSTAIDGAGTLNNSIVLADGQGNVRIFSNSVGNVGIGTTSPSYKLQVNADGAGLYVLGANTAPYTQTIASFVYGGNSNSINIENQAGKASIQARAGGSTMDLLLNPVSGNVGIGTGSPTSKLHIDGIDPFIRINNVGSANTQGLKISYSYSDTHGFHLLYNANNAASYLDNTYPITPGQSWGDIYFRQNGGTGSMLTRMTIKADGGNVGIGTTSPSAKLDVVGEARFGSNYKAIVGDDGAYGGYSTIGFGGTTNGYNRVFGATGTSDGLFLCAATGRDINFRPNGGTTDVFVIGANGYLYSNSYLFAYEDGSYNRFYRPNGTVGIYLGASDAGNYYDNTTHYFRNSGGGANYAIIDSNGNVGIGTTSPSQKLVVIGNAAISGVVYTDYVQTYSGTSIDFRHQDASVVMRVDTANARVGIGTTSPAAKLDVIGKGVFGTMASSRAAYSNGLSLQNNTGEATSLFLWQSGVASAHIGSPANNTSLYIVNSYNTGLITDPNSIVLTNTGNVGIGTTSPSKKLDVVGTTETSIRVMDTGGSSLELYQQATDSYIIATNSTRFYNGGSERVVITSSGNVGIGTTSPQDKLTVKGTTDYNLNLGTLGGYSGIYVYNDASSAYKELRIDAAALILQSYSGGNVGIGTTNPAANFVVSNAGASGFEVAPTGGVGSGVLLQAYNRSTSAYMAQSYYALTHTFNVGSGAGTRVLDITSAGNVGIGTSSPTQKLDVSGNIQGTTGLTLTGNAAKVSTTYAGVTTTNFFTDASGGVISVDGSNKISLRQGGVSGTDAITIAGSGNVGIGTTNPAYKLDVFGIDDTTPEIRIGNSSGKTAFIGFSSTYGFDVDAGGVGGNYLNLKGGANGSTGGITFSTFALERMRIDYTGNVGIGTTSPAYKLDVNGATQIQNELILSTNDAAFRLYRTTGVNYFDWSSGQDLRFSTVTSIGGGGRSTAVTFLSTGNVGIGTASPSQKLHLYGSGNQLLFIENSSTYHLYAGISSNVGILGSNNATPLSLQTNGVSRVYIDTSGNVGIGTTSPNTKFNIQETNSGTEGLIITNWNSVNTLLLGSDSSTGGGKITLRTNGGTSNVFISSYGISHFNGGNVGIGTDSPGAKLTILAASTGYSSDSQIKISDSTTSYYGGLSFDDAGATRLSIRNSYDGTGSIIGFGFGSSADKVQIIDGTGLIVNEGNVGIGTTSPNARLTVVANDSSNPNVALRLSSTGYSGVPYPYTSIRFGSAYSSYPSWNLASIDAGYTGSSWGGSLLFYTNNDSAETNLTERMRITSGGNVGIGTTSPSDKLTVAVGNVEGIRVQSGNSGFVEVGKTGGDRWRWTNDYNNSNLFELLVNDLAGSAPSQNILTVNGSNSYVGIGTTSPSAKLDVNGSIYAVGDITIRQSGSSSLSLYRANSGYQAVTHYWEGSGLYWAAGMGYNTYNWVINDTNYGVNNKFVVTQGTTWGVGVGTASPGARFHSVADTSSDDTAAIIQGTGSFGSGVHLQASGTSGRTWRLISTGTSSTPGAGTLGFYDSTAGLYRFVINTSGNVGIGTTSPGYKLETIGNARISGNLSVGTTYNGFAANIEGILYLINGSAWVTDGYGYANASATTTGMFPDSGNNITFKTNGSNRMNITSAGEVNINTTVSYGKLNIIGYDNGGINIIDQRTSSAGLFYSSITFRDYYLDRSASIDFYHNQYFGSGVNRLSFSFLGSERMSILYNGNVGIGTTAPGVKLQVEAGSIRATGTTSTTGQIDASPNYGAFRFYDGTTFLGGLGTGQWAGVGAAGDSVMYLEGSRAFHVSNGATPRLTVSSAGNVGIGTTSPSYKLDVYGGTDILKLQSTGTDARINIGHSANGGYIGYTNLGTTSNLFYVTTGSGTIGSGFVMDNAGNVGIGTTSPTGSLDIYGTTGFKVRIGYFTDQGADDPTLRMFDGKGTRPSYSFTSDNTSGIFGGSGFVAFSTSASEKMRITSGGNVGIGVTPSSWTTGNNVRAIQMNGGSFFVYDTTSVWVGQNMHITGALGNTYTANGVASAYLQAAGAHYWNNAPSGTANTAATFTTRMVLDAAGYLGIGTTSPSAKLHIGESGAAAQLWLQRTDGYNPVKLIGGTLADGNGFKITMNTTDAFSITSAGNVGIGTTSPASKLQIGESYLATSGTVKLITVNTGGYYSISSGSQYNVMGFSPTTIDTSDIYTQTAGESVKNFYLGVVSEAAYFNGNRFSVFQGGVERLTIQGYGASVGNVGIGTTSPTEKLHIVGTILSDQGEARFRFNSTSGTGRAYDMIGGNDGKFYFYDRTATSYRYVIDASGNVGIGTTSPGGKLEVNTSAANGSTALILRTNDSGANSAIRWQNSGGTNQAGIGSNFNVSDNGALEFINGTTTNMILRSSGNVGIGTTSPVAALHVQSSSTKLFLSNTDFVANTTGSGMILHTGASSGNTYSQIYAFQSGNTAYANLVIPGGNVGIGTTSPSYKLHVEGNVSGISIYASHDIAAFSDITVKKEVKRIENAVDKVKELNGYTYVRTDDETGTRRAGVIAQEVQKVLPEVVSQNPDGTLNVAYANMIALLIEGIKEQQATIERLENRIKQLEK